MVRSKNQVRASSMSPVKKKANKTEANALHPALAAPTSNVGKKKSIQRNKMPGLKRKSKTPYRPGAKALQEIKLMQRSTNLLLTKLPFSRIVREVMMNFTGRDLRITPEALSALQESAEAYLVQFLEDANLLSIHAKRVTLMAPDIILLKRLRGRLDPCN
ncbi:Hypothetical predicted protein [Cloeon dipterum]|uniref:Core Histone H2A/H2B/H3 domain-containing protein n=1 Tax=Cloeon dipterum TaxID=197152 RepID=A0A8S1DRJ3_9INSE|nr:Hypothetical predicted protein [Cloeon dipterum]